MRALIPLTKTTAMAKKDPAFLFYPQDFLTGTMFMSNEDVGIYVRLLCAQHQCGGIIPKASFLSLAKGNDPVISKFVETDSGFINARLMDEMEKRNKKSSNISEAARETWRQRKGTTKDTIVKNIDTIVQKNDTPYMQSEDENENVNDVLPLGNTSASDWRSHFMMFLTSGPSCWLPWEYQASRSWSGLGRSRPDITPESMVESAKAFSEYSIREKTKDKFIKKPHTFIDEGWYQTDWTKMGSEKKEVVEDAYSKLKSPDWAE